MKEFPERSRGASPSHRINPSPLDFARGTLLALALASGCLAPVDLGGEDAGVCSAASCLGCCDAKGQCQAGTDDRVCGRGGAACGVCTGLGVCGLGGVCAPTARCTLPSALDWAGVALGDRPVQTIALTNPTDAPIIATLGDLKGDPAFSVSSFASSVPIPARQTHLVEIRFAPTVARAHAANITMRLSDGCPDQVVSLNGLGVDAVLTWTPEPVDFSYLPVGLKRTQALTFHNSGLAPVTLTGLTASVPDYTVAASPVVVPPRGTAPVSITAKPSGPGPRPAAITFATNLPRQPAGSATLKCYGGGPDIDVDAEIDLGSVAYFSGATTVVTGKLVIRNVGTAIDPPDPKANLHLGGTPWIVVAKSQVPTNTAQASEICVGAFVNGVCMSQPVAGSYDPSTGLEAMGARGILEVPIRIAPQSIGWKEWVVFIYSDDPDEPEAMVTIRAQALVVPPCDYSVTPTALDFGMVASGATRDLDVTVKNRGTHSSDVCLMSAPFVTGTGFSLVGAVSAQPLQPGTSRVMRVRFSPQGTAPPTPTPVTGTLTFSMSNPNLSAPVVSLTATTGPSCLSIVPNRVDFGTIAKACNSATRTLQLYNTCAAPIELVGWSLRQAGTELVPVSTAGLAPGTLIALASAPATFSLKYAPTDEGDDAAAFEVTVKQGSDVVDYVLPITGTGDAQGLNFDALLLGGNLKADILLVVDTSGSMLDKQTSLGAGFPSFVSYANSVGLDYQIGVTTADMGVEGGRLVGTPKIITSSMPNVNTLYKARVQLGTSGSANEELLAPALAAVTAPLVTTDNAGFLRSGATLGIVAVSDADDQSPQTVSYYVSQLQNVKPPGQVSFSAIAPLAAVPPVAGCTYDGNGGAPRTLAAVAGLGGLAKEICTPNWDQGLLDLGPSVFGAVFGASSFPLGNIPDLTGGKVLTVKVNGVDVAPTTATGATVWTYDNIANRVIFSAGYAPAPGEAVTATYFVACIP